MTITPDERTRRLAAIARAIDWLEAHPEKHIAHTLAKCELGEAANPKGRFATCFCALGRVIKEADIAGSDDAGWDLISFFQPLGISHSTVFGINDLHVTSFRKDKAIKHLRSYMLEGHPV